MPGYCDRCGMHVPDGMYACRMCGNTALAPARYSTSLSQGTPAGRLQAGQATMPRWLIIVAISLVVSPVLRLHTIFSRLLPSLSSDTFQPYFVAHPGLRTLVDSEIAVNAVLVLLALILNYLFYTSDRRFPPYMIAYAAITFLYLLGITASMRLIFPGVDMSSSFTPLVRSFCWAGLLIPYLLIAPEVKTRFVE